MNSPTDTDNNAVYNNNNDSTNSDKCESVNK